MLCGTGSFKHVDADDQAAGSPRARRNKHGGGGKAAANPYADRGLDKFSTVLADLESRRDRILRRVGGGLVLVRFVQSDDGWEPIVVKLPDDEHNLNPKAAAAASKKPVKASTAEPARPPVAAPSSLTSSPTRLDLASPREAAPAAAARASSSSKSAQRARRAPSWGTAMRRPAFYWPAVVALMLACMTVFGRVFAICCVSIWWYLAPTLIACSDDDARLQVPRRSSMEKRKAAGASPPRRAVVQAHKGAVHEVMVSSPTINGKRKS